MQGGRDSIRKLNIQQDEEDLKVWGEGRGGYRSELWVGRFYFIFSGGP